MTKLTETNEQKQLLEVIQRLTDRVAELENKVQTSTPPGVLIRIISQASGYVSLDDGTRSMHLPTGCWCLIDGSWLEPLKQQSRAGRIGITGMVTRTYSIEVWDATLQQPQKL